MSIETRPAYLLDRRQNTIKRAEVDAFGNEVIGHTTVIIDDSYDTLVPYNADEPVFSPKDGGSSLDEKAGRVAWFEGLQGSDLVTDYDITNPAKYPETPSALSTKRSSVSNN